VSRRRVGAWAAGVTTVLLLAACGKRGNPLPPLRPVPARVTDLAALRADNQIELQFTVPAANADGSTPLALSHVEIYRAAAGTGAAAPTPAQILADAKNLRGDLVVRTPESAAPSPPQSPAPGERARFVDRLDASEAGTASTWNYLVVGVAGRARRGQPSAVVTVPLGSPPAAPESLTITYTETQLTLTWKPAGTGQSFAVYATGPKGESPEPKPLNPKPIQGEEFTAPVEFGRERCLVVRPLIVSGGATVQGPLSRAACATPVDTFPPAAPANLQAIQEGTGVALTWTAVDAQDLSGYVVLRGDATGVTMQPLMREPIRETTFRDAGVQVGATYTYSVYAIDKAPAANASQQSNRQVVTVR